MVASVRTSSLLAILVFGSALTSCMTLNHGYTPKAGETVVSLDSGFVLPVDTGFRLLPAARIGVVHAVADWLAFGLDSSVNYVHYYRSDDLPSEIWFVAVRPSVEAGFAGFLGATSLQLGFNWALHSPLNFVVVDAVPVAGDVNLSWAYSYDFQVARPYIGLYVGLLSAVQAYLGVEVPCGRWVPYVTVAASALL